MSRAYLSDKIRTAFNTELTRRLLIKYFMDKGMTESFEKRLYPPTLQDMTIKIPQLRGKIEIQPFVEDIDPNSGAVKLGWNLFVLGTKRMYLGESVHTSLQEVTSAIGGPLDGSRYLDYATPKRMINFIVNVLSDSKQGDIPPSNKLGKRAMSVLPIGTGEQSGYFKRYPVF